MNADLPLIIRPATTADEDFIVDSWVQSYIEGRWNSNVRTSVVKRALKRLVPRLIEEVATLVAVPESEPALIAGWACGGPRRDTADFASDEERNILHYVYVRASYRTMGIATQLQAALGIDPTKPLTVSHLVARLHKWPNIIYDPYALFEVL